jgi:hypothetical protein
MGEVSYFNATEFTAERVRLLKYRSRLIVVFSTFGEREAELIRQKIALLDRELGGLVDNYVLSHRRQGSAEELTEARAREARADVEIVICNGYRVPDMGDEQGKGADMRRCLYHINTVMRNNAREEDVLVVFLDADVLPDYFGAHFVLGLAGAVLEGFDFAKAGFWRAMGRVKKYVAQPLFSSIEHPRLAALPRLSYPLAGEVAGSLKFLNSVSFWQRYGVETGIDIDASARPVRIADVNLGRYDHEHQGEPGIQKMAFGIIRTYLMQLRDYGIIELKDGARIADVFRKTHIDEDGALHAEAFDLSERKYAPLTTVL